MLEPGKIIEPFSVISEQRGTTAYLIVRGDIDVASAPALGDSLRAAQLGGSTGVVLDLEHVSFMDAGGLRSLLQAAEHAVLSKTTFTTVSIPAKVSRLFDITGTASVLDPNRSPPDPYDIYARRPAYRS